MAFLIPIYIFFNDFCGYSCYKYIVWKWFCNHISGSYYAIIPLSDTFQNSRIHSYPNVISYFYRFNHFIRLLILIYNFMIIWISYTYILLNCNIISNFYFLKATYITIMINVATSQKELSIFINIYFCTRINSKFFKNYYRRIFSC